MDNLKAQMLLNECTGVDIWPIDLCRAKGVPESWVEELADCFESGFRRDEETIYYADRPVNQYHGVDDLGLARRLAEHLGVDINRAAATALTRAAEVRALQEAVDEL